MVEIFNPHTWGSLLTFVKEANNYLGDGDSAHDPDGNEAYFVLRNGKTVKVLSKDLSEDGCVYRYFVDEEVHKKWKELFGYTL